MTEDNYDCKVCGDKFEEKEDLTAHGKDNHPVFTESYAKEDYGLGGRPKNEDDRAEDLYDQFDEQDIFHVDELVDQGTDRTDAITKVAKDAGYEAETFGDYEVKCDCDKDPDCPKCGGKGSNTWTSTVYQGDEIDQQQDKPVQSHDDWQKELEGLKDEFSEEGGQGSGRKSGGSYAPLPEETAYQDNPSYDPYKSTPKSDLLQTDPNVLRTTEGGADDPLRRVADLSENYRFLSKDAKAKIFESIGITQGDANILAGLQWNELTRPVRVEISEAYAKEEDEEEDEKESELPWITDDDKEGDDEAYENFYNLEKNHSSPDYKKKAIECNRCNEKFYHIVDRDVHFNEVHATEDTYKLPEECPFCHIELPEGQDLDYHMSTAHGAHVPSEYTQTGVDAGMSDANWDRIEYAGASRAKEALTMACDRCGSTNITPIEGLGRTQADWDDTTHTWKGYHCNSCGFEQDKDDVVPLENRIHHVSESRAKEISRPITDKESMLMYDKPWDELTHDEKLIMHGIFADESKATENDEDLISKTFYTPYEMRSQYNMDTGDTDAWSHSRCKICGNDSFNYDYDKQEMVDHAKSHGVSESYAREFTLEDYRENEDNNYHDENVLELVKKYGTPSEIEEMEAISQRSGGSGINQEDYQRRYQLHSQYFSRLSSESKAKEYLNPDEKLEYDDDWYDFGEDGYNSKGYNKDGFDKEGKDEYGKYEGESRAKEAKISSGDLYQYGSKVGTIRDYNPKQHEGYVTLDGIGIEEFGAMTSDYEVRVNGERIPNKWDGKHDYNLDLFGESKARENDEEYCDKCGVAWRDHGINCRGEGSALPEEEGESKATEDGMYANFGKKDNDDSWTVLTVGSDLLFFNSREEAEDYTKNMPSGTYSISPPKSGKESYAKEGDLNESELSEIFSDYKNNEQAPYSEQSFEDFVAINYPYMLTPHESRVEFHKWVLGESRKKATEDEGTIFENDECPICKLHDTDVVGMREHIKNTHFNGSLPDFQQWMVKDYWGMKPMSEVKANESNMDQWWWKEVKWESGFDQDFLYCNHCGADLYAEASWVEPLNNVGDDKMNRVVPDHLRNHGISESYSKETLHGDTNKEGLFYWKPTNEWLEDSDWELRDIIEGHPKVEEADTRWVKGQDEKWHEVDSSDRDYEQGLSEKPEAEEIIGAVGMGARAVVGAGARAGTNVAGRVAGDEEDDYDESLGTHTGICRACKERKFDLSNDSGYCSDCD